MIDCANLIHPFQSDPGVSQRQRIMDDLLSGAAKIDGRSMADLLDYFVQLSRHVNYYNPDLSVGDWQPFFRKSIPFLLVEIIKYRRDGITDKVDYYTKMFERHSSERGLQLLLHYFFYQVIRPINNWNLFLKNSGLPAELIIEKLIKDKLREPLKKYACLHHAAVRWYCVRPVNLQGLLENQVWGLDFSSIGGDECKPLGSSRRDKLLSIYSHVKELLPSFMDAIRIISDTAEQSMEQSFFSLKEELQQQHTPHLALLFAFLKLFQYLQNDLNSYTKKHLDFFYKEVLRLKDRDAVADKAHIVFEIQKQLNKYLFKKGLLVKDGKDNNKSEILFSLEDEIVVNKTQVAEKRTLFVNNQNVLGNHYVEGVYMAPNADKSDGAIKDFKDTDPKIFPTLGAKMSKYIHPEKGVAQPYPNARIGFILASPVLLLNEGTRNVTISFACQWTKNCHDPDFPLSFSSDILYARIRKLARKGFYLINDDLIAEALKRGINVTTTDILRQKFLFSKSQVGCCGDEVIYNSEVVITARKWRLDFYNALTQSEKDILSEIFIERRIFKVWFSGKEEWIKPGNIRRIRFSTFNALTNQFTITIKTRLKPDQPAVTFHDKEKLKEDIGTSLPAVKIELDDVIKIHRGFDTPGTPCCLLRKPGESKRFVSLYHFFRDVKIIEKVGNKVTKIDVRVCGLKSFIVQNDESVQDVNGPVYPFGTRPEIIDFDAVNPANPPLSSPNLVGPNFYIGSMEALCKKWSEVYINIKWKDKPASFREYYKGYLVRKNYHDCDDINDNTKEIYGLNECDFQINLAVLQNGSWIKEKLNPPHTTTLNNPFTGDNNRMLFASDGTSIFCKSNASVDQTIKIFHNEIVPDPQFDLTQQFNVVKEEFKPYNVSSRNGFLKINLQNQDFLHKNYSYVLARQMMAFGRYPDLIDGAVYIEGGTPQVFDISIFFGNIGPKVVEIASDVVNSAITGILNELIQIITDKIDSSVNQTLLNQIITRSKNLIISVTTISVASIADFFANPFDVSGLSSAQRDQINTEVKNLVSDLFTLLNTNLSGIEDDLKTLIRDKFDDILVTIDTDGFFSGLFNEKEVIIPNEPWTPIIKNISLDYSATATSTDIDLIHLYPYEGTYKQEEITLQPTFFATFCDEGTLHLGLKDLEPGSNVNVLFQLAEATADSETDREEVDWFYLDNNQWKALRTGFEVLHDATEGLTTSGIIKFALPENITTKNTILPKGLHWIKVALPKNSRTVSETMAIYTQAILTVFTNDKANDKLRLDHPLAAGAITKLNEADANLKKLIQPFESFGGRPPEGEGHFYIRVSELLRHKGRAIQKFDYERIVLEAFPQVFKVKCITHSFGLNAHQYKNDFPIAPGYVLLAVIPDLNQLKAPQSFEPRVPVSMLNQMEKYLKRITSPFVRFRAMNPRYEKIHFCMNVKLVLGKDENYYKEELKQDLREFLAPWAIGQFDKLSFGQCVGRSEIIQFLETRDYVDYITDLLLRHEENDWPDKTNETELAKPICPKTPRSILIAGEIDVCILNDDCESWGKCVNSDRQEVDCCENKKIPITEYCRRDVLQ